MNLNIKIDKEKIKKIFQSANLKKNIFNFFAGKIKLVLFLGIILASAYSVYVWYVAVYKPDWNDARKQEYIKNKDKGTAFDNDRFEEIISEFSTREENFDKKIEGLKDIFRLNK